MSFFASSRAARDIDKRDRDRSPLLHEHRGSVSLQNLSPRASPSPPPSFYRDLNLQAGLDDERALYYNDNEDMDGSPSPSLSPSKTKGKSGAGRRIQFSAPPPPITSSVLFRAPVTSAGPVDGRGGSGRSSSRPGSIKDAQGRGTSLESTRGVAMGVGIGIGQMDPLLVLERRERALQTELQELLDAQSAGLLQGFGGAGGEAESDAGSSTPTSRSLGAGSRDTGRPVGVMPVRQPKRKVLSLRGARRGLLRDMGGLVAIKNEEKQVLEAEIARREDVLGRVRQWEERIEGVREQLSTLGGEHGEGEGGGEEAMEIAELKTEERAVDNEIREMEDRLMQMRARKRWLGERIREGVNRQEARASGYRGALREVEGEVKEFLRRPPVPVSVVMGGEEGFIALPPNRRTLGLAKDWWRKEVTRLQMRLNEVEKEKSALEDGAGLWTDTINAVVGFEDELRRQMAAGDGGKETEMLRKQVGKMGEVIRELEATMTAVSEKGWNLMICAVGAELEAFKEGERILRGALQVVDPDSAHIQPSSTHTSSEQEHDLFQDGNGSQDDTNREHSSEAEREGRDNNLIDDTADESREDTDNDSVLHELNNGVGALSHGHARASFGSEAESNSDEGPNLAELMVDRSA
jgi:hypothetical protein